MKTKNEHELIELRKKRFKKLNIWNPSWPEFLELVKGVIVEELENHKDKEAIQKNIDVHFELHKVSKFYLNMGFLFAEFHGVKGKGKCAIVFFKGDILIANAYQKDLVKEHVKYIFHHEVSHFFGKNHEEMENIKDFGYPIV